MLSFSECHLKYVKSRVLKFAKINVKTYSSEHREISGLTANAGIAGNEIDGPNVRS